MDIYESLRKRINNQFTDQVVFGDEYFDDKIFEILESNTNIKGKGKNFEERFKDIISDPNNLFIKRHPDSGKCESGVITLHNGLKVYDNCYYDKFSEILKLNLGVHEPSEERAFGYVLDKISDNSTMIELGSYWAFYSSWFKSKKQQSRVFCVEPNVRNLKSGIDNFKLNNVEGEFYNNIISNDGMKIDEFCNNKNINFIDILHSDIQGAEMTMLNQIEQMLKDKKINYIFLSTHSNSLHEDCLNYLTKNDYRTICQCDFENQTFQFDGFILACPSSNQEIKEFYIGDRSKSEIISDEDFKKIKSSIK